MSYTKEAGYGRGTASAFVPVSPNGRQFIVGAATLNNIRIAQETFKHDADGILRMYSTLAAAVAGAFQSLILSTTVSTSAHTFTTAAAHGLNNGDKVQLTGTTAPTNFTLGVVYYVVGVSGLTFKLSLQRGGTEITPGSAGTTVKVNPITSVGDTIYILPGHNENVSSSTALNLNVAGITVIGLGRDEARPTFYLDTGTTSVVTISAPAVTIKNCIFDGTGFAAIATIMTITAPDVMVQGCKFITGNSTNQAGLAVTTNAQCNRLVFDSNYIYGSTDSGTTNALQLIGGNDIVITNNMIFGSYTTSLGPINNITTACLRIKIENNILVNATASSTKVIVLVSGSTGVIRGNELGILSGTAPITAAGAYWMRNYYAASVGSIGILQ